MMVQPFSANIVMLRSDKDDRKISVFWPATLRDARNFS
jgi:hypothetical protein